MKKLLLALALFALPATALAAPVAWDYTTNLLQPLQSGWNALVKASRFQATSTTASIFPYASTTVTSAARFCLTGDSCISAWPSGSSGFSTTSTDYWLTQQDTGDLAEGSNLYWTLARGLSSFITNLAATTSVSSITTLPSLSLPYSQVTGGPSVFSYLFPANATSTKLTFSGGLLSTASTTIGDGTRTGGLTVNGYATTTGSLTGPQFSDAAKYFYLSKPASDFNIMRFPGSTDQAVELQVNPSDVPNPYFRVARTDLARSFVDTLWEVANTGGVDQVVNAVGSSNNIWFKSGVNGTQEAAPRIRLRTDFATNAAGGLVLGDGTGAGDANLYRSASDTLKTDDSLSIASQLTVSATSTLSNTVLGSGKVLTLQASGATNNDKLLSILNSSGAERMSLGYASTDVGLDINNRSGSALYTFLENGRLGIGSSTPGSLLSVGASGWNFYNNATSTKSGTGGVNISDGCYAVNGTCLSTGGSSFSYPFPGNATSTSIAFNGGLTASTLSVGTLSGLLKAASGAVSAAANGTDYTLVSAQSCTNQVLTALTASGGSTCSTVSNAMLANSTISGVALGSNLANLTATDGSLTFSGTYNGSTARTVGLNLANANTWTALQTFAYASTTAISATATSTFSAGVGIATSTPWARLTIDGNGSIVVAQNVLATSTSMTVDWRQGNSQNIRMHTAGVTVAFTGYIAGQSLLLTVCNGNGTSGSLTFSTQVLWSGGTAPSKTTAANKCDLYSFRADNATSSLKIFGAQTANF